MPSNDELWLKALHKAWQDECEENSAYSERSRLLRWAFERITTLQTEKSWESPYRRAIGVLEQADAAFMGNFG